MEGREEESGPGRGKTEDRGGEENGREEEIGWGGEETGHCVCVGGGGGKREGREREL